MREHADPTKLAMLRRIPALRSAPDASLAVVAASVDVLDVRSGQRLTIEGRPGRSIFLVVEGRAVAERDGRHLSTIGAGDVVADLPPTTGGTKGATVQAVTSMRVLVAGPGTVGNLLDAFEAAIDATSAAVTAAAVPRRAGRVRRAPGLAAAPA